MIVEDTALEGLKLITPKRYFDDRGFFSESYNRMSWRGAGLDVDFMQDNHTLSRVVGTVRGLHFQNAPFEQQKLVRVLRGRIFDVAVDLRPQSRTFGHHFAVELSDENWRQLFVPIGFAHGYLTLAPDTQVLYKVDASYSPGHEAGLSWNDPQLAIPWPVRPEDAVMADRDRQWPTFREWQAGLTA